MPFSGYLSPYSRPLDPGTPEGAKAYQKCVQQDCPDDERLVVSVGTATAVRKQLIQDSNTFCFGAPVHAVPIKFKFIPDMSATGMGTPGGTERPPPPPYKMVVAEKGSILLNSTVPEANVLLDMYRAWGNYVQPTTETELNMLLSRAVAASSNQVFMRVHETTDEEILYERVKRKMIGDRFMNTLDKKTLANIKTRERCFTWIDGNGNVHVDGPVILKFLMDTINPSTKVELLSFQSTIEDARLNLYGNDVNAQILRNAWTE